MDNIFLAKILKEHARLIIPGFGAFLRKEGVSTGLVFSPFLKKDDGVLGALLCQEYGVSNFDGEGMIAEWVQHIREALSTTGKYHIDGVGLLMLDANGAIAMVEEPVRKIAPLAAQQMQSAPVSQNNSVQPRPLVQAETMATGREFEQQTSAQMSQQVAGHSPASAQNLAATATIAQQIVEQIQQVPARPLVAPQPVGAGMPRVAPRPMNVAPRPAAPMSSNIQRPGMQQPNPQGGQPRPQGAGMQQPNPQGGQPRPQGAGMQQNPQGGQPRPQGAGMQQNPQEGQPRPQGAGMQQGAPKRPQTPGQRPPQRPRRKQSKFSSTEIWLIVAIVAALAVAAIIIWSLIVLSSQKEFYSPDNTVETITIVDSITGTQE